MTAIKPTRHKWTLTKMDPEFPGSYQVDQCEKCNCLRIHLYSGNTFSKSFLINGAYSDKTPSCLPKTS